ncbi:MULTISPECIES: FAD-dependent oxidoreductase [unclassified Mesorhizobium]|uniref:FAD-dependent oxidoreductase n=1 Tax=unclassified Mesorhizobium TaxID=325217 RepID=UPI000FE7957D|nr:MULTISPECIES: FAD-dependent oxidoreductase [unclassified Mesorhizobium]RWB98642.1 MAG: FAD-dependent oxidoreductase [Mesorhizobium sp.]TGV21898.1 FAD-dependent oxidoreductase [Mesorhizobium sp. M4B.F.Ca.ET.143.01.1.1]
MAETVTPIASRQPAVSRWDAVFDVIAVGSGAAGLSAALYASQAELRVLVCEKSPRLGGTTALSNGMIWIPCSPQAVARKVNDSIDNARTYLKNELGNYYREDFVEAYLADGPAALVEIEKDSNVEFTLASAPDYHSSQPGGVNAGRALSPAPYDGRLLGEDFDLVGDPIRVVLGGMMISSGEVGKFLNPFRSMDSVRHVLRRVSRYAGDRMRFRRGTELSGGNALIARFITSLRKRKVDIWTQAPLTELITEDGKVIGAVISKDGRELRVKAEGGVVLATGGFARNAGLRAALSGDHQHDDTLAHPDATGDGIRIGLGAGGEIDNEVASAGFWTPVSLLRDTKGNVHTVPYGWLDRGRPGVIAVGPDARRFVNESNPYHDICIAMFQNGYPENDRFYFICDHEFLRKRGMGQLLPWPWTLSTKRYERVGYIQVADTLAGLAGKIGIDPNALEATVNEHNEHAKIGTDPYFHRGESAFNRMLGDPSVGKVNPNLGPIKTGPFVALKIVPATLGTATGLTTDTSSRVLDAQGKPIEGLFACGNDATSVMRGIYPGAGITIGPGIVFAYRAVKAICEGIR